MRSIRSRAAGVGGRGQAAADDLAEHGQVRRRRPRAPARRRGATRKPVITSSKTSSAPGRVRVLAQQRAGSRAPAAPGPCWPGSGSHRSRPTSRSASAASTALAVVPRARRPCPPPAPSVTPGARRDALRGQARAGLGEQPVHVAVVGAGELQDLVAAGGGAREPDRAHRRLGARRGHAHHLGATGIRVDHLRRQLDLAPRSARRSSCRARRPRSPRRPRPGARGRRSAGPRT